MLVRALAGARGRGSRPSASCSMWSWLATPSTCSNSSACDWECRGLTSSRVIASVLGVPEVLDVEGDAVEADLPDDPPRRARPSGRATGGGQRGGVLVAQEARAVRAGDRVDHAVDVHVAVEAVALDRDLRAGGRLLGQAGAAADAASARAAGRAGRARTRTGSPIRPMPSRIVADGRRASCSSSSTRKASVGRDRLHRLDPHRVAQARRAASGRRRGPPARTAGTRRSPVCCSSRLQYLCSHFTHRLQAGPAQARGARTASAPSC